MLIIFFIFIPLSYKEKKNKATNEVELLLLYSKTEVKEVELEGFPHNFKTNVLTTEMVEVTIFLAPQNRIDLNRWQQAFLVYIFFFILI